MSSNNPFQNIKATEAAIEALGAKVAAGLKTAEATVAKDAPIVKADAIKVETAVVAADGKLTAFIKNNAGKIAVAVFAAVALAVWKLI